MVIKYAGSKTHLQPRWSSGTYTMPHLDTVAGDTANRSMTSNSILIVSGFSLSRSPLGRHSIQLSSSTCALHFRLSSNVRFIGWWWHKQLPVGSDGSADSAPGVAARDATVLYCGS